MEKGVDHVGVCVIYFCHDGKGNFLMLKRKETCRDEHGRWDIGGGGLELNDTVEKTLKKEIREEYCTSVISYKFLGFRDVHRIHKGIPTHWIGLDFKVIINPKKVKNGEPHKFDEVRWFRLENLPPKNKVHSQLPFFIKKYKNKLK
jgi:8-oxo-dGTP pyrophosphatase MutT (NUDIX family)